MSTTHQRHSEHSNPPLFSSEHISPNSFKLWAVLLPSVFVPVIGALFYFVIFENSTGVRVLYACTKLFILIWPLLASHVILNTRIPYKSFFRISAPSSLVSGVVYGFSVSVFMWLLMQTSVGEAILFHKGSIIEKATLFGILDHFWIFAISLSLVHSLIEEFYWRWFVYGNLRKKWGVIPSQLSSAAAFSAHHFVIAFSFFGLKLGFLLGLFIWAGGVIWCRMYEQDKNLIRVWISHFLIDLSLMSIGHYILFGKYL